MAEKSNAGNAKGHSSSDAMQRERSDAGKPKFAPAVRMVIEDMGGHSVDEIRCTNCSGRYCGRRNVRVVEGTPLAVCNLKLETIDILAG